jgi:Flp pilus assembly protein TadB
MTMSVPVAAALGWGTGVGLLLLILGLTTPPEQPRRDWPALARWRQQMATHARPDHRRWAVVTAVGVGVALVTRWPVAAVLSALGAWVLPGLIGPDREHTRRVARLEAIAVWTESLRDNLAGAAGLEQSLTASAIGAPAPIAEEVTRLVTRLHRGWHLPQALRGFAADLADPAADLVVAGLLLAASGSAGHLREVFGELAASARATVASRQRIAADRQRTRTSARVIVGTTLGMAAALILLNRGYLQPFDTAAGQVALAAVGACFACAFAWLAHLMRDRDTARVLAGLDAPGLASPLGGRP